MKYIYILVALIFMGCSEKAQTITKAAQAKEEIRIVETVIIAEQKEVVKQELARNETLVEDPKVVKSIASDVPSSCAMWSDGSNICTRVSQGKASCTTNPVANRMFSCLQWQ